MIKRQFILEIKDMNSIMIKQGYIKIKIIMMKSVENCIKKDIKKIEHIKDK